VGTAGGGAGSLCYSIITFISIIKNTILLIFTSGFYGINPKK
jgi:hypothetical protein